MAGVVAVARLILSLSKFYLHFLCTEILQGLDQNVFGKVKFGVKWLVCESSHNKFFLYLLACLSSTRMG